MNVVTMARVSSREQVEGYSLDAQSKALKTKAVREGWTIVKSFAFQESAKKASNRKKFREMIDYVRRNKGKVDAILFHKTDRAARNLQDYILLDELSVDIKFVNEDYPKTAAGRMSFAMMVVMARYYIENLREEVLKGMNEKCEQGWFPGLAPHGYSNIRPENGKSIIVPDPEESAKVRRIFQLYGSGQHTIDSLRIKLEEEGLYYSDRTCRYPRSTIHAILRNPFYIGRFSRHGVEFPGKHEPIINMAIWEKVQRLIKRGKYQDHALPYARMLFTCKHCGSPITGERKYKKTKSGIQAYDYYRCVHYSRKDHPRERMTGADMDREVLNIVSAVQIGSPEIVDWFKEVLLATHEDDRKFHETQVTQLQRQYTILRKRLDGLYKDYLDENTSKGEYERLKSEWSLEMVSVNDQLKKHEEATKNYIDVGVKLFELSQVLPAKFVKADPTAKRHFIEAICLNCTFGDGTLCPTYRKPFDLLAKGLVSVNGRGDWI